MLVIFTREVGQEIGGFTSQFCKKTRKVVGHGRPTNISNGVDELRDNQDNKVQSTGNFRTFRHST